MQKNDGQTIALGDLPAWIGRPLGQSAWHCIDQAQIDAFAAATGDRQWIHTDPDRAARCSPYGGTVAHGFLTLALLPLLSDGAFTVSGVRSRINYGLNKVRFPAPVRAGSQVRGHFTLAALTEQAPQRWLLTLAATVEIENQARPACAAEMLVVYEG